MANKAFEIQNASLRIGGVELQAGTTGVVIPGVTVAVTFRVEEVEDVDDQTYQFAPDSEVVVIDAALYATIVADGNVTTFADFTATTDEDGEIDEIRVNGRGTYTQSNAGIASTNDMYAYIGEGSASDRPLVPQDWIQIPFRPKMRAGEVETIGGGGADLGDFTIDGNILEADSMTIRTVDDDMTIESDSDIFISVRDNGNANISDQEGNTFKFEPTLGKITFPDNSEQTTAYTGENDLAPLLTKTPGNTLELNSEIIMTQDLQGVIAVATGDYNFDVEFNAATGDAMGNTYAVGQADGARFIMAFNPDSTLKWAKEVAGDADFEELATLQNIRYDGENNEILVGYNCAGHTGIARVNPGDGSIISSQRIIPANPAEILSQNVFFQDANSIFVGGTAEGERTLYSDVPTQTGTNASERLVVNWADIGSPPDIGSYYTNSWFIDTLRNGTYIGPSAMCTVEGLQPEVYPVPDYSASLLLNGNFNGGLNSWTTTAGQFSVIDGQLVTNDLNSVLTQNMQTPATGALYYVAGQYIAGSADSATFKVVRTDLNFTLTQISFAGAAQNEYRLATFQVNSWNGEQYVAEINVQNGAGWMGDNFAIFQSQNRLINGYFETGDFTGWELVSGSIGSPAIVDGRANLSTNDTISQTLTVVPGARYIVRLDYDGVPSTYSQISVTDGSGSLFFGPAGTESFTEGTFVPTSTSVTVAVAASNTTVITGVLVTLIPGTEPVKSGMTVSVAYERIDSRPVANKWYYSNVSTTNVGSNYVTNDFLRIPGSQLDGVDSDFIFVPGGSYTVETVGSDTVITIPNEIDSNLSLLNVTDFKMWGKSIYGGPNGPFNLTPGYTVTSDETNTYLTVVGVSNFPISGDLLFVDLVNGNDIWGIFVGNIFNYYNNEGAPSLMKIRFRVPPAVDFTIAPNWDIQASLGSQAFITKMGEGWSRTLGDTTFQRTHSIATSIARNEVYMLVEDGSKIDRVNLLVLDYGTGQLLWQRSISNGNARGGEPGTVLASGDFVYVVSTDNTNRAMVTKLDAANEGALVWQRRHNDGGDEWDGRPVAAFASDGNIIVAGVYYEDVDENDDVLGFWKLNAETGALMFKTYVVDRQEDDDFFEYAEAQCQPFSIVNGYIYYGAYSDDDDNDYNIGVAVKIKDDGTGFGQYGRWEYMANPDPFTWVDNTSNAQIVDRGLTFVDELSITIETANIVLAGDLSANREIVYRSELIGREPPKITFPDESELTTAGIGRLGTDDGGGTITLTSAMNGKFIYFNNQFNGASSTIIVPPNTTTPLPIGFTVTLAVGEFGGQPIYVVNDSMNVGPDAATLYASGSDSFGVNAWQLAGDGKTGLYTIMKIDTNTWMIAGPNVQVD